MASQDDELNGAVDVVAVSQPSQAITTDRVKFTGRLLWSIFFTVDKQTNTVTCKLCNKALKFTGPSPRTSTANDHLNGKKHSKDFDELLGIESNAIVWDDARVDKFKDAVVQFAAKPGVSLETVVSDEFRQVLAVISPQTPLPSSPNTVKKWLIEKSTIICNQLKIEFQPVKGAISASIDIWSDSAMLNAYVGITLHFIKEYNLVCRIIGLVDLPTRHTAEEIKERLNLKLAEFGLTMDDIYKVVTDNGSNMVKAFSRYEVEEVGEDENSEPDSDDVENLELEADRIFGNDETIHAYRYSCAAHNLQLCLFHGVKSTLLSSDAFKALLKLQSKFSHSQQARNELKNLGKLYKRFIPVRWGTWIDVVERYLEITANITQVAIGRGFPHLSASHNSILEEYLKVLKMFKSAIVRLEYENQPTVSWVFVLVDSLKKILEQIPKPNDEIQKLCETLIKELNARFDDVIDDPLFIVATLIDPATSHMLIPAEERKARKKLTEWVTEELESSVEFDVMTPQPVPLLQYVDPLQAMLDNRSQTPINASVQSAETLVDGYVSEIRMKYNALPIKGNGSERSLEIVSTIGRNQQYRSIVKIANKILAVPATGSPVERVFSTTGMYTHGNKSNTKIDLLNSKLIVYKNK